MDAADLAIVDALDPGPPGVVDLGGEVRSGDGESRGVLGQAEQIIDDEDLPVAIVARADPDDGNRDRVHHRPGYLWWDGLYEDQNRACLLESDGVADHLLELLTGAPRGNRASGDGAGLWLAADMGADRDPGAGHVGHEGGETLVHLELDDIGVPLGHESPGVAQGGIDRCVVAEEGHVGHDQRVGSPTLQSRGDLDGKIDRHADRAVKAEHNLGGRIARQQDMDACAVQEPGGGRVVAREAGETLTARFEAFEGLESNRLGEAWLDGGSIFWVGWRDTHTGVYARRGVLFPVRDGLIHEGILRRPDLGDEQVLRVVCGLRPCRRGGLRIETERLESIKKTIVHNYGHGGCGVTLGYGTAIEAAWLVEQEAEPGSAVAVLGSGVVGLTSALELLQRGFRVTVYAEKMAAETTTLLAGALWLPTGIEFGDTPERVAWFHSVLRASHQRFQEIDRARFGVERLPVYEPAYAPMEERYFNNGTVDAPTMIERLPVAGPPRSGKVFSTDFIHTGVFLNALVAEIKELGGRFVPHRFGSTEDLGLLEEPVLVNATALGSRTVFGDQAMYAARGILVHLKPQDLGYCVHDGYKYMFPRRDCLILGGCFLADDWNDRPDEAIAAEILAHHRRFFGQI